MASKKPKLGRPKADVQRDRQLTIWLSDAEYERVHDAAEKIALSTSAFARMTLLEKIDK